MSGGDAIAFLFSLERLGMKFGLENMAHLCAHLGHPENSFRSVLIAGTNGKGSVTAMVETSLRAAGHRTARYTSPHLERLEERFVVNGAETTTDELREAAARVQRAAETLTASGTLASLPTFFECTTAAAFELFRERGVEIAVLEAGLGGRLDATNIVTPLCAAITSIALDHQAQLGESIEAIAREKAGIAKPAVPLVCGPVPPAAAGVIARVCAERGAPLRRVADLVRVHVHRPAAPSEATFDTPSRRLPHVVLALDGRHQIDNAAVALCVLDMLGAIGLQVDDDAARTGLSSARWPGRTERVHWHGADVLLDAAHNPAGACALKTYLDEIGWRGITLVFGVMGDKDALGMLKVLAPISDRLVLTTPPTPRAMAAPDLHALAARIALPRHTQIVADPRAALADAARPGARVVVAGSLFLIGAVRGILR